MPTLREKIDGKWMTQFQKWNDANWGRVQQDLIGENNPQSVYKRNEIHEKTMDNDQAFTSFRDKTNTALELAKRRKRDIPPQFTADYQYNARRGEFYDYTSVDSLVKEGAAYLFGSIAGIFGKGAKNAVQNAINSDRDRAIKNSKVLNQNLLSRWNYSGAGQKLLGHGALKANPNGQTFRELGGRMADASKDNTVAGQMGTRKYLNRDGYNEEYKLRFANAMGLGDGGSNADKPSNSMVEQASRKGFNVGQLKSIVGGKFVWRKGYEEGKYDIPNVGDTFSKWLDNTFTTENSKLAQLQQELKQKEIETVDKIVKGSAGYNRVPINFYAPINLVDLLKQNLLVPPPALGAPPGREPQGAFNADASEVLNSGETFDQLYLQNRSRIELGNNVGKNDGKRNPRGTIAGVSVADLQGPFSKRDASDPEKGIYSPDDRFQVFKFTEDKERNNPDAQDRGFRDNISGNVYTGKGLDSAVRNATDNDSNSMAKTLGYADEQFFPFMFETINKKGSRRIIGGSGGQEYKQYAYFQATLQSINESYNPTWSSKHFFGRTEQIHSYTMTDRSIELSFVIFASEIRRLQNVYERVNWLAQQTYASYDENGRMKGGPIIRMTIGDMFAGLNGFIRSLSFDWNYLGPGGKWEITQGLRVPMACTVQMSFNVVHERLPDRNTAFYPGPIIHPTGMFSERGLTNLAPFDSGDAPLIINAPSNNGDPGVVVERNNRQEMYINQIYNEAFDVFDAVSADEAR